MKKIVFALPGNEILTESIIKHTSAEKGNTVIRSFPDGETYVRILSEVANKHLILVCTLHQPDSKIIPLYFFAKTAKELGASKISLVAPYLSYMRQDKRFNEGEAVTNGLFAVLISSFIDELITVDPHLHRTTLLSDIYTIPCKVLHASELIAEHIRSSISNALLIGPDSESEQWVSEIAQKAKVPFIILQKKRSGDKNVKVSVPFLDDHLNNIPVLVDDIISTARTMIETVQHLKNAGMKPPVCIGVHAVFADNAYQELKQAGVNEIISCNTIQHHSNKIDLGKLIAGAFNAEE